MMSRTFHAAVAPDPGKALELRPQGARERRRAGRVKVLAVELQVAQARLGAGHERARALDAEPYTQ